jgi:hypothetical protein
MTSMPMVKETNKPIKIPWGTFQAASLTLYMVWIGASYPVNVNAL